MTYDEWRLQGPDEPNAVGTQGGETCGRYPEPDEDLPRGYKPKPCKGTMMHENDAETVSCAICGEIA